MTPPSEVENEVLPVDPPPPTGVHLKLPMAFRPPLRGARKVLEESRCGPGHHSLQEEYDQFKRSTAQLLALADKREELGRRIRMGERGSPKKERSFPSCPSPVRPLLRAGSGGTASEAHWG